MNQKILEELLRLDKMELDIYETSGVPINFSDENTEKLKSIKIAKRHLVRTLAAYLGMNCEVRQ